VNLSRLLIMDVVELDAIGRHGYRAVTTGLKVTDVDPNQVERYKREESQ